MKAKSGKMSNKFIAEQAKVSRNLFWKNKSDLTNYLYLQQIADSLILNILLVDFIILFETY